jgi:hypothetical protein
MANCSQPFTDISEFLREKQRDGEIHHEKNRKNQSGRRNPIHVHGLPQLFARLDVKKRQGKENGGEKQHDCVLHATSPVLPLQPGSGIRVAILPWSRQTADLKFILTS